MPGPRELDTWMRWEFDKLNTGVVIHPKSLESLLARETLETRDGEPYDINRAALDRIATVCSPAERKRLRLPITVHFSADVEDSAYVIDDLAADVLRRLEGWGPAYPYHDGRMWLPASLAVDLVLRYRGAVQRFML